MIRDFASRSVRVLRDTKAVTAAEYAILAVGIVIIVGAAVMALRGPLLAAFTGIGSQITTTQGTIN